MENMDLDKYDRISKMEDIIDNLTKIFRISDVTIIEPGKEQQILYILTIISILYKQKCFEENIEKITKTDRKEDIKVLEEIISKLQKSIKNNKIYEATMLIQQNEIIIQEYIKQYFIKKHTNYITEKHQTQLIIEQNKQKELLKYNPLIINQLLKVIKKPLTTEELIIDDILEFIIEAQQTYIEDKQILHYIKQLIKNKYQDNQDAIAFIISNVYQELKEQPYEEKTNTIIHIMENKKITKQHIIDYFHQNDEFASVILKEFLKYNLEIKQGRLKELEQKPSKEYAKKMYK